MSLLRSVAGFTRAIGPATGFFLIVFLCVKYAYRLWSHPLAKYPGPLLARASSLWGASAARRLRKAQAIQAAHERYGPVVRIGPNELSFSSPDALKTIYGQGRRLPKTDFYTGGKFTDIDNVFSMRDVRKHSGRRAVMAPAYSNKFVSTIVPMMGEKLKQTLDMMKAGKSPVDIYEIVHMFSLDVVFHFTLNRESGTLKTGKPHPVIRDLEDFQSVFAWTALLPPLRQFGRYLPFKGIRKPFVSLHGWIQTLFCLQMVARERTSDQKASFINRLLENKDEYLDRQLNDLEVAEELIAAMFAGAGTSANTIIFLVWSVLRNPQIHQKLREELAREIVTVGVPDPDVINRLPYLNAVIMETLRRYPTIPGTQPRMVVGSELHLGEHVIPVGTTVGCQNYTVHRDPATFPDPELFDPERWLQNDTTAQRAAFNGFGTGPRACIGRNLAMLELQMFVSAFFLRFEARITESLEDSSMEMTDGFSGGPARHTLPLYLSDGYRDNA